MSQSLSFDPVADRYDQTRVHPPEVAARIAVALIAMGRIPDAGHVLEIGIGTGRIALPLLEHGIHVTGVDISPRMVERLEEKYASACTKEPRVVWGRLNVELADMTALPFASKTFDAVVAVHVLHLVSDWRRALDEALRVVRPGRALLLGQDLAATSAVGIRVQDQWLQIIRRLGHEPARVGAATQAAVFAEIRQRGLPLVQRDVVSWEVRTTPRAAILDIAEREWSRTWAVPEPLLTESVRQLTAWVELEYPAQMDVPQPATYSFRLACVRSPSA